MGMGIFLLLAPWLLPLWGAVAEKEEEDESLRTQLMHAMQQQTLLFLPLE